MNQNLNKYINHGHKKIEGWISQLALKAISKLSEIQQENNIKGSVCEIGVHHGRSFVFLHMLTSLNEMSVAVDLFEMQSDNIDKSGKGDKEKLIKNLNDNFCDLNRIKIITENSLNISPSYLLEHTGSKVRIFSVDGGHSADIVYNDLKLAERSICGGGIIILDDFFANNWPGVAEGSCKYLMNEDTKLIPFSTFDEKILFTNSRQVSNLFINGLYELHPEFLFKESMFFDNKVIVVYKSRNNTIDFFRKTKFWQIIKNSKHGNIIRKILSR